MLVLLSIVHHGICALSGLMRDPESWHHWDTLCFALLWLPTGCLSLLCNMSPSSACVRIVLDPLWFSSARPLVKTLKRTDESGDPCGVPIVSWWGAELQFSGCIATILSKSAPAIRRVNVRLTLYYGASPSAAGTQVLCMHLGDTLIVTAGRSFLCTPSSASWFGVPGRGQVEFSLSVTCSPLFTTVLITTHYGGKGTGCQYFSTLYSIS